MAKLIYTASGVVISGGSGNWSGSGNWLNLATGGISDPTTSDDVYCNSKTIIINNTGTVVNANSMSNSYYPLQGTITSSTSSTTVTGVGTKFTTELFVGSVIRNVAGTSIGTVQSIGTDFSLTLTANAASTNAGISAVSGILGGSYTLTATTTNSYTLTTGGIDVGLATSACLTITGTTSGIISLNAGAGEIKGSSASGGSALSISATGLNVGSTGFGLQILCGKITGGVGALTTLNSAGITNSGANNSIYINSSGDITGGSGGAAIAQQAVTGYINLITSQSVKGGSVPAFLLYSASSINSSTQIIQCANITPSASAAAIAAVHTALTSPPFVNTSAFELTVSSSVNTSGSSANSITPFILFKYKLTTPQIKFYDTASVEKTFTTSALAQSWPAAQHVLAGTATYSDGSTTYTPTLTLPQAATVFTGVYYGIGQSLSNTYATVGTLDVWSQSVTPYTDPTKFGGLINQLNTNLTSAQQVLGNVQSVTLSTQGTVLSIQSTGEINQTNILGAQSVLTATNSNVISAQTVLTDVNTNVNSVQQVTGNIQQVTLSTQAVVDSIQAVTGTPQDIANQVWSDFDTNPNNSPYIQRVHNVSTVDTTGQQISTI